MGKIFRFILKVVLIILYPVFVASTIALGVIVYLRSNEINNARRQYEAVRSQHVSEEASKSTLAEGFDQLGVKLGAIKSELDTTKKDLENSQGEVAGGLVKKGYGQVTGEILPFVTGGSALSQFQLVCAEEIDNVKQIYCVSVSAVSKDYNLILPVGDYYVYAQLPDPTLNKEITDYKAYYTEFVKCNSTKKESQCAASLSNKKAKVTVVNAKTTINVNPIDWNIEGLDS